MSCVYLYKKYIRNVELFAVVDMFLGVWDLPGPGLRVGKMLE